MAPVNVLDITQSANAISVVSILNSNAGTSAQARFRANNGTSSGYFGVVGQNYTPAGVYTAGDAYVIAGGNNLNLVSAAAIKFAVNNNETEIARIDTSGNLLVGTSSVVGGLNGKIIQAAGSGTVRVNAATTGQYAVVGCNAGASYTHTQSYLLSDDTNNLAVLGTATATPICFYINSSEAARFDTTGRFLVNQTSASAATAGTKFQVATDCLSTGSTAGYFWENRSGGVTSNTNWYGWYTSTGTIFLYNGSANIASINSSTGAYSALSDRNKKKDIQDSNIGLDAVMQLKPSLYRMLDEAESAPLSLGFIAQDIKNVIPEAYVEIESINASGKESTFISFSDRAIIAVLTKAIQELTTRLTALETK
jgi:hypothetical protein